MPTRVSKQKSQKDQPKRKGDRYPKCQKKATRGKNSVDSKKLQKLTSDEENDVIKPVKPLKSEKETQTSLLQRSVVRNFKTPFNPEGLDDTIYRKIFTIESINFAIKWELEHLSSKKMLENIIPLNDNFVPISSTSIPCYLPREPKFVKIEIRSIISDECIQFDSVGLFQFKPIIFKFNSSLILNCGGPVWGLDWCPYTDYLAVSTHKSVYELNLINKASILYPGVIQLYKIDLCTNHASDVSLICHEFSPILYMKFCPHNQIIDIKQGLCRIGLLAFCGADNIVRIISLPNPSELPKSVKISQPNILLKSFNEDEVMDSQTNNSYRALCFDWHPRSPHTRIVVGYSDGHFSIFNIKTEHLMDSSKTVIVSYPVFIKHVSILPLINVKWYPHDDNIIICGGYDGTLSFYNIHEPRSPVFLMEKGLSPILNFPYSSNVLLASSQYKFPRSNCVSIFELCHNKIEMNADAAKTISERYTFVQCASITDIQSCPRSGYFCASDDNGMVYISNINERYLKTRGNYIVETFAYRLKCINYQSDVDTDNPQTKELKTIVFEDCNELEKFVNQRKKLLNIKPPSAISENTYDQGIILSINRVALHTSPGKLCWLASGGNTGLVRIQSISRWAEDASINFIHD